MDMQLAIVLVIVGLAIYYFIKRMVQSVKNKKCSCCEDGSPSICSCGCGRKLSDKR
ncbi:MAG: hypothetical protein IJU40_00105 [Desulfovibrionaceae bacterium]|nr:hypothetical protein [Desulfovibrionaceae bacterium]